MAAASVDAPFGEVASVPLTSLPASKRATSRDFCVRSGAPMAAGVINGALHVLPGSDNGQDQTVEVLGKKEGGTFLVRFRSKSDPNRRFELVSDRGGEGRIKRSSQSFRLDQLRVRGIAPGELGQTDGSFAIADAGPLDPFASSATIEVRSTGAIVDLAALWSYNKETNAFTISRAKMAKLVDSLPNEEMPLSLGLVTKDGNKAGVFDILIAKEDASIIVQPRDNPAVPNQAVRRAVVLTGEDNTVRRAGVFGAGPITFQNLPAGRYRLQALTDGFELSTIGWPTLAPGTKQIVSHVGEIPNLDLKTNEIARCAPG